MKGLYKNELLKLISQTGFKVVLIIALVLSLLTPLAILGLEELIDNSTGFLDDERFYTEMLKESTDPVEKAFYEAMLASRRYFREKGMDDMNADYRYAEYFGTYESLLEMIYAYRLLEKGISYEQVSAYFLLDEGYESEYSDPPFTVPGRFIIPEEDGEQAYVEDPDFHPPTAAEAGRCRALLEGERTAMEKMLEKDTLAEYYTRRKDAAMDAAAQEKSARALLTAQLDGARPGAERQKIEYELAGTAYLEQCHTEVGAYYAYCAKADIPYTDWRRSAGTDLRYDVYRALESAVVMGEDAWREAGGGVDEDYESYLAAQNRARAEAEAALAQLDYSLAHDLPLDTGTDPRLGGKSSMLSSLETSVSVTTLFLIVAAGMSVAREHADGTVRLLLIRPKKRGKILLSKYLALLTYGGGVLLFAFLVQGVIFTVSSPLELLSGSALPLFGEVVALPALLVLFLQMLLLSVGAWVLMTMAFFFSVLMRRSALAILLPILSYAAAGTLSLIAIALAQSVRRLSFLRYTVLPYLDIERFLHTPLENFIQEDFSLFGNMQGLSAGMCFPLGLVQLLFIGSLFTFFAFFIFRRQQIKS